MLQPRDDCHPTVQSSLCTEVLAPPVVYTAKPAGAQGMQRGSAGAIEGMRWPNEKSCLAAIGCGRKACGHMVVWQQVGAPELGATGAEHRRGSVRCAL